MEQSDSNTAATAKTCSSSVEGDPCEAPNLCRLSSDLAALLVSSDHADARIAGVPVHRCILSVRSPFLRDAFRRLPPSGDTPGDGYAVDVELRELVGGEVEVGREALVLVVGYLYSGTVGDLPRGVCTCADGECRHEACRPAVAFLAQVLYLAFVFQVPELVSLFQRRILDVLHMVAVDDLPFILLIASKSSRELKHQCVDAVSRSDLDIVSLERTLPPDIVRDITDARVRLGIFHPQILGYPDKHVTRIHRAIDCDDVELVRLLLKEGSTTLDDAYALHYAVAHCDSKITIELLDLNLADVNLRNLRGYTVLHVAALRRDPKIIVSLLTKGARPFDLTKDGRKAVDISRRLTTSADFFKVVEKGVPSPKDRLCIEILEQAERRNPQIGEASVSLAMAGDDVRGRLLYLENRVALARVLFPMEARVAMELAQVDGTLEFTLGNTLGLCNTARRTAVDLNETPFAIKEEHLRRMKALSRTVELGKRFFPRCSEVLNKIMDDESTELFCLGTDTTGEKRRRLNELQVVLRKAFSEDKQENDRCALSSSSSSLTVAQI